jgi:hypothetical protein
MYLAGVVDVIISCMSRIPTQEINTDNINWVLKSNPLNVGHYLNEGYCVLYYNADEIDGVWKLCLQHITRTKFPQVYRLSVSTKGNSLYLNKKLYKIKIYSNNADGVVVTSSVTKLLNYASDNGVVRFYCSNGSVQTVPVTKKDLYADCFG